MPARQCTRMPHFLERASSDGVSKEKKENNVVLDYNSVTHLQINKRGQDKNGLGSDKIFLIARLVM